MQNTSRRSHGRLRGWLCLAAVLTLLAACASAPPDYTTRVKDPWEKLNRITYAFNDKLDKAVARPVAKQYLRAVPLPARDGIHNFLSNLGEPVTIVNDLLQGQIRQTFKDTTRFLVNTTAGVAGWFDVAKHLSLPQHDADLGETLAHWGVPAGPYVVIPLLGPSDLRDGLSLYPDYYANPVKNHMQVRYRNAGAITDAVDTRAGLLNLDSTIDSAFDPYSFVRDAWIQHRRFDLYNGNPPSQFPDYPDLPPDDSDNSSAPAAGTVTTAPAAGTHAPTTAPSTSSNPPAPTNKNGG
ncbi:MAG: VacJ family lipoprotein [Gammaproteobacteria bacterium]|nr:VacJ family lipoprotein [Gammaproteobacteria bacterium]MDE2107873.1 VacJ family lipoprotein [Gammaproteobacteria bacterium]